MKSVCKVVCFLSLMPALLLGATWTVTDDISLTNAFKKAGGNSEIVIEPGTYKVLASVQPNGTGIKIRGKTGDPKDVILDCNHERYFLKLSHVNTTVSSITVKNGYTSASGGGGAINADSTKYAMITNCIFDSCYATNSENNANGGAIAFRWDSNVSNTIVDCVFINNHASKRGGALDLRGSYNKVIASAFVSNSLLSSINYQYGGGALYAYLKNEIRDCVFDGNYATYGGALYSVAEKVEGCSFINNFASQGGAMHIEYTSNTHTSRFSNCYFGTNTSKNFGPVVRTRGNSVMEFDHTSFVSNYSENGSAVIFQYEIGAGDHNSGVTVLSNCVFKHNENNFNDFTNTHRALLLSQNKKFRMRVYGTSFIENAFSSEGSSMIPSAQSVENSSFIGNNLSLKGRNNTACISIANTENAYVRNCLFVTNRAIASLGMCINIAEAATCTVDNCTFAFNYQADSTFASYGSMVNCTSNTLIRNCLYYKNNDNRKTPITYGYNTSAQKLRENISEARNVFNCFDGEEYVNSAGKKHPTLTPGVNGNLVGTEIKVRDEMAFDFTPRKSSVLYQAGSKLEWMDATSLDIVGNPRIYPSSTLPDIGAFSYWTPMGFTIFIK